MTHLYQLIQIEAAGSRVYVLNWLEHKYCHRESELWYQSVLTLNV